MTYAEFAHLKIGDRVTVATTGDKYSGAEGVVAGFLDGRVSVQWPDGQAFFYPLHMAQRAEAKDQVFNLRGAWRLMWHGVVPATTWRDKGAAEAQLALLRSGHSVLCADGSLRHVGAGRVEVRHAR